jgi:hypothetical protein
MVDMTKSASSNGYTVVFCKDCATSYRPGKANAAVFFKN